MKQTNTSCKQFKILSQQGVGMVEVMVALLIFSIGMLGIASLQVTSIKTTFEAEQRYEATVLVDDLLARMNSSGIGYLGRAGAYGEVVYDSADIPDGTGLIDCSQAATTCNIDQKAAWDIYQWQLAVRAQAVQHGSQPQGLKGAKGCLSFPDGRSPRVTVVWESMTDLGDGPGSDAECGGVTDGKYRHYSGPRRST